MLLKCKARQWFFLSSMMREGGGGQANVSTAAWAHKRGAELHLGATATGKGTSGCLGRTSCHVRL